MKIWKIGAGHEDTYLFSSHFGDTGRKVRSRPYLVSWQIKGYSGVYGILFQTNEQIN